jgi:pimeloyl-ACP methyl ester carboxylesterase
LPVPLDYSDPLAPMIDIGFMWFPASEPAALPTIVAEEGGPGFPSTGSRSLYVPLFAPLLVHRNLLLVDNRGTGRSTLINCPSLERFPGVEPNPAFLLAVQQCGDALDHHWRRTDGTWVHASDLVNTANSARDLAGVLRALQTGPVDLYGDSYGTWFAQTFASRYPSLLHSLTLDASYQVLGLSPWYATTATVAHTAFDTVCALSVACSAAAPGSSWARIGALARDLRVAPIVGQTVDTSGHRVTITVDIRALVNLVNDAGFDAGPTGMDAGVYRELDAHLGLVDTASGRGHRGDAPNGSIGSPHPRRQHNPRHRGDRSLQLRVEAGAHLRRQPGTALQSRRIMCQSDPCGSVRRGLPRTCLWRACGPSAAR